MYGPNTPTDEPEDTLPEWHEPFPEPNPFPAGWNFGSTNPASASAAGMDDEAIED